MARNADIYSMKTALITLLFSLFLLSASAVSAAEQGASQQSLQDLRRQLHQRLAGAVSFEAIYELSKPGKSGVLRLIYNGESGYWLLLGELEEEGKEEILSWLDLKNQALYLNNGPGRLQKLDLTRVFDVGNADNPWNLLLRGMPADAGLQPLKLALRPHLQIAWQKQNLDLGMGVEFYRVREQGDGKLLQAGWLSEQMFASAREVRELEGMYTLVMPGSRLVNIDKRFGLLHSDIQLLAGDQEYRLGLRKVRPMQGDLPVSHWHPDLDKLSISEADNVAMGRHYFSAFVIQVLARQEQGVNMSAILDANLPAFVEYAGELSRQYWQPQFQQRFESRGLQMQYQRIRLVVVDEYNKYVMRKNNSDMSLAEFIDHSRIGETLVESMLPNQLQARVTLPANIDFAAAPAELKQSVARAWQGWHSGSRLGQIVAVVQVVLDALKSDADIRNPLAG